jgi:hypothetical protein
LEILRSVCDPLVGLSVPFKDFCAMRPNDTPQIATTGGGVIGASGSIYDQNGNVIGQNSPAGLSPSWTANAYQAVGPELASVASPPVGYDPSYAASAGLNISATFTSVKQVDSPQAGLYSVANTNFKANSRCSAFFDALANIAKTKQDILLSQVAATASGSRDYIYDGPSSNTPLDPAKFPGAADPAHNINTVGQLFNAFGPGTAQYIEALSQFNGYAIFLRFDDWWSWLNGLTSQYIKGASGKVNAYGLGTLTHEVLHKQTVAGGFTHDQMDSALAVAGVQGTTVGRNHDSDGIAQICFSGQ